MHDSRGAPIKVGDRVLIEAKVTELNGGDENFCCCSVEVVLPDQAGGEKVMSRRPALKAMSTKMLTKIGVAVMLLLAFVSLADAGPFRRLVGRGGSNCPGGVCPTPQAQNSQDCPGGVCPVPQATETVSLLASRSLAKETFAGALQKHLGAKANKTKDERHILNILNAPDSPKRDRQLARMEGHVRLELGIPAAQDVNWASFNWPAFFQQILAILIQLLPLLLG